MDVDERLAPILYAARIFFDSVSPPIIGDGPVRRGSIDVDSGMLCGFSVSVHSNASCLTEAMKYLSLEVECQGLLLSRNKVTQEALRLIELLEDDDNVGIPHETDIESVNRTFTFPSRIFRQLYGTDSGYPVNHTVNYVLECFSGDEILDVTTETRPFAENKTE